MSAIVQGSLDGAINKVESVLAGALPLGIELLAKLLGLSKVDDAVQSAIDEVKETIDNGIDSAIEWIRDTVGLNKKNADNANQPEQGSGESITKDSTTKSVSLSENIPVSDKSRGFNQADVTATGFVRPTAGNQVNTGTATSEYNKQLRDSVAQISADVDASKLSSNASRIASRTRDLARAKLEQAGMSADGD